jgi:hypothetical protein
MEQGGGFGHPAGGEPQPGWGTPAGGGPPAGYGGPPPGGPPAPAPDAAARVAPPAIALIFYAGLGIATQTLSLILHATGVGLEAIARDLPPDLVLGGGFAIAGNVLSILVGALMIYGALQMRNLRLHTLAIVISVVAFIPILNPCCCFIGLGPGIWALFVLLKPEIKAAFQS